MSRWLATFVAACLFVVVAAQDTADVNVDTKFPSKKVEHIILISVDGMHTFDVDNIIKLHPDGGLAKMAERGYKYTNAFCTKPSDSFPGMLALVSGGSPRSTQVYYDDAYDRDLYAPGDYACSKKGTEVNLAENVDASNVTVITSIDATKLPRTKLANGQCVPVYPHSFVKVNTIFEVLKNVNKYTAWSDKHPSYDLLRGPSGKGIDDLYTPEINNFPNYNSDQQQIIAYDSLKCNAILNQIDGKDGRGLKKAPVPTLFGMNFQSLSVIQKNTPFGGYLPGTTTPNTDLERAIALVDNCLDNFYNSVKTRGMLDDFAFIITAKHGQTPAGKNATKIAPKVLEAAISGASSATKNEPAFILEDDVALIWLLDATNTEAIVDNLNKNAKTLGIKQVLSGADLVSLYGPKTSRTPDIIVVAADGVIYTKGSKTAEHGGFGETDNHVGLVVSAPGLDAKTISKTVTTTQVAPTMLSILDIDGAQPSKLQALKKEVPVVTVLPTS